LLAVPADETAHHLQLLQGMSSVLPAISGQLREPSDADAVLALAMGVTRMARRNAIVKNLSSVETLGSTTVICTDKTGTLTQNLMMVNEILADGERIRIEGQGYEPRGTFYRGNETIAPEELYRHRALRKLIDCAYICNNAKLERTARGMRVLSDPTEGCLQTLAARAGVSGIHQRVHLNPFESVRKRMSVVVKDPRTCSKTAWVKGAPTELLECCTKLIKAGKVEVLTSEDRRRIRQDIDTLATQGYRVLGFAVRDDEALQKITQYTVENTERELVFLGITAISDPVRPGVTEAIHACHTAGIRIAMITGDYPLTARSIGMQIGLGGENPVVKTGSEISFLSDDALKELLRALADFFERHPILFNFVSNPLINLGIVSELLLCYFFFYTDLRKIYFFEPVPWQVYLFACHGFLLIVLFEETRKYFVRRGKLAKS
jgi:magnesium-transporting ATPase (P-type)